MIQKVSNKRKNISPEELIQSLRDYYAKHGKVPSSNRLRECGLYVHGTYVRKLKCKSWAEVLQKAGLPYENPKRKNSKEELIQSLRDYYAKHGKVLFSSQLHKNGFPNLDVYLRVLKCRTWDEVLGMAGISQQPKKRVEKHYRPKRVGQIGREELIRSLRDYYKKHSKVPPASNLIKHGLHWYGTYLDGLGCSSWKEVIRVAGLPEWTDGRLITKEQLLQSIQNYHENYGSMPRTTALRKNGLYSFKVYLMALGCSSWKEVLQLAERYMKSGVRSPEVLIKSLRDYYIEHGTIPSSDQLLNHGLYSYRTYIRGLGCQSWEEVCKLSGVSRKPRVKGRKPKSKKREEKGQSKKRGVKGVAKEKLLQSLRDYYKEHGIIPPSSRLTGYGLYNRKTYLKGLGCKSWTDVLDQAGILYLRSDVIEIAPELLIQSLVDYRREHGNIPPSNQLKAYGLYDYNTYVRKLKCKSWAEVLQKAGIPYPTKKKEKTNEKTD